METVKRLREIAHLRSDSISTLSEVETDLVKERVFDVLDSDRDALISVGDLGKVYSAFNIGHNVEKVEADIRLVDIDRDGVLNFQEFLALVETSSQKTDIERIVQLLLLNEDFVSRSLLLREKKGYLCDMDGVIYRGGKLIDGVRRFLCWVRARDKKLLFITNNSKATPKMIQAKLHKMGLDVPETSIFTAAQATASFLISQKPRHCTAYVVGGPGLHEALATVGVKEVEVNPDYVVVGESDNYSTDQIRIATQLVYKGAKLIGANVDPADPVENGGVEPSCGAWVKVIETATGKKAYFCGKPNPIMMREALRRLGLHTEEAAICGDRMDTDVIAGVESRIDTVLVLSGVSTKESVNDYPYRPYIVLEDVGRIPPDDFNE